MNTGLLIQIQRLTICLFIVLSLFTETNGQERQISQAASLLTTDNDLRCKISAMTGVGCDTVKMKQILQLLAESKKTTTTENRLTAIKAGINLLAENANIIGTVTKSSSSSEWTYTDDIPTTFQWYVSPDGNDTNAGTQQSPFRTINKAINTASVGDAIKLENGKYNENVYLSKNVYLIGNLECPQSVIIDARAFENAVYINNSSPELHGMKLINGENGFPLIYIGNGYPRLSHLILTENPGMAVEACGSFYFTLYNTLIYGNHAGGNDGALIKLNPSVNYGGADIVNTTIADNQGSYAIHLTGPVTKEIYITNSILYNPQMEVEIAYHYQQSYIFASYSNIRNKDYLGTGINYYEGVIDSPPYFDENDPVQTYHLWDYSPCIDAGRPDFYDRSRPPGKGTNRSDMGFYGWESRTTSDCSSGSPGDDLPSAIDAGTHRRDFEFDDSRESVDYTCYYNWVDGVDVFYRFTITVPMDIIIEHCGSTVSDTYIALLSTSGGIYTDNDDGPGRDACPSALHARLVLNKLQPGVYCVMSKVKPGSSGTIRTRIRGFFRGDVMQSPIDAGTHHTAFQYSDPQNTGDFTDTYTGQPTNDVFYRFTITKNMDVEISHCGSGLDNTYLHLLDAFGNSLASNDDYSGEGMCTSPLHAYLKMTGLEAGTYYVVSEGQSGNGSITTRISGTEQPIDDHFGYPENETPSTEGNSSDTSPVGTTSVAFNVSPTGAATFSLPVMVPQGLNGLQPSVSLTYNSQSGNGIAGWGCNLSGISAITRVPKTVYHDHIAYPVRYDLYGEFALDGERLFREGIGGVNTVFTKESDPYTYIVMLEKNGKPYFEVRAKDGMLYRYGSTSSGRQEYTAPDMFTQLETDKIYAWYLDYVEDPYGNYMEYSYDNKCMYPVGISYGNNKNQATGLSHYVQFGYETRPDVQPFYLENKKREMNRRLKRIVTKTESETLRVYELEYSNTDHFSRLVSITEKNGAGESLKPVNFTWDNYPSGNGYVSNGISLVGVEGEYDEQIFATADLNGDGISDFVGLKYGHETELADGSTGFSTISQHYLSKRVNNQLYFSAIGYRELPASLNDVYKQILAMNIPFNAAGDGKQYLMIPFYFEKNYNSRKIYFFVYDGLEDTPVPSPHESGQVTMSTEGIPGVGIGIINKFPLYTVGDVDNDGKDNIIYIEKVRINDAYAGKVGQVTDMNNGRPVFTWQDHSFQLPSDPEKIFVADFNGDGMNDLMVLYNGGYDIYWNNTSYGPRFNDSKMIRRTGISDCWMIRMGDFNGDGLPDFIMNATNDPNWYFALNQGNGIFIKSSEPVITLPDMHDHGFTEKDDERFSCQVLDFNFDGKSDVVITKAIYDKGSGNWGNYRETRTIWLRSTGTGLIPVTETDSNREDDAKSALYTVGDFNGDGHPELANFGYDCFNKTTMNSVWRVYRLPDMNFQTGKVTSVTDGMGNQTDIGYANFTDPAVYTKGTDGSYPAPVVTAPLPAVKSVTVPDGVGGTSVTTYKYEGLKVHLTGKGLLGLSKTRATNDVTDMTVESTVEGWSSFGVPVAVSGKTSIGGNTISSTRTEFQLNDRGYKRFSCYPRFVENTDHDTGITEITEYIYGTNGNLAEEKISHGYDDMYKKTVYSDYVRTGGSNIPNKPRKIALVQKHRDDDRLYTQETEYTYDGSKGHILSRKDNAHSTDKAVITRYTYGTWGNVLSETVEATGIPTATRHFEYDRNKRLVSSEYSIPSATVTSYAYDTWGNPLTVTDLTDPANAFTTTYRYDGWGRKTAAILHDGRVQKFSTGWGTSRNRKYFTLEEGHGMPWVKTWYDASGRETETRTIGAKGMAIQSNRYYNDKGQLDTLEQVNGELSRIKAYEYDERGRILEETNNRQQSFVYTYETPDAGRTYSVTTNVNDSKKYTKTYDAWGNIRTSSDPAGTVEYFYHSNGLPDRISVEGADFRMTYDEAGNQSTLDDPNAGIISYRYDALGRVIWKKDARGQIETIAYDDLGRIENATLDGIGTSYEYVSDGNGIHQLKKIQTGDRSVSYAYDRYGRMVEEKRQMSGENDLTFTFSYDAFDRLKKTTYPEGLEINHEYDTYGNLARINEGSNLVWELDLNKGTYNIAFLGSDMSRTSTYSTTGILENLNTYNRSSTTICNFDYSFHTLTGNLDDRTGMIPETETFRYDDTDRLELIRYGNKEMKIGYDANGNIKTKTGLGSYVYHPDKKHAVTEVDNTGDLLNWRGQTIEYTAFHKASNIKDTIMNETTMNDEALELDIIYGPEQQRWKSELQKDGTIVKTTIFAGDYEKITENGITRHLYYISGGDGLAAVYVKQAGEQDKTYYAHTDHLGSIVKLTDNNGNPVFQASYDAWGLQTLS
jgi:YD repeat-containing protein